jgi:hypothetical protein
MSINYFEAAEKLLTSRGSLEASLKTLHAGVSGF